MPRIQRQTPGGLVFHVLNRGVNRQTLFETEADYAAFLELLALTLRTAPVRICAYCVLPNHWHLVLWPEHDGQVPRFLQKLTNAHVQRWQRAHRCVGHGHGYQGRYKSFPTQEDDHFYTLVRYVERNAQRAGLADRAEQWRWGSLHGSLSGTAGFLAPWALLRPAVWTELVNAPQTEGEVEALRRSVRRGCPFGAGSWSARTAARLGLEATLRPWGRPRHELSP